MALGCRRLLSFAIAVVARPPRPVYLLFAFAVAAVAVAAAAAAVGIGAFEVSATNGQMRHTGVVLLSPRAFDECRVHFVCFWIMVLPDANEQVCYRAVLWSVARTMRQLLLSGFMISADGLRDVGFGVLGLDQEKGQEVWCLVL